MSSDPPVLSTRRRALQVLAAGGLAAGAGLRDVLAQGVAPTVITGDGARPQLPYGVMSGDVTDRRAIVWSRADRAARMIVTASTNRCAGSIPTSSSTRATRSMPMARSRAR